MADNNLNKNAKNSVFSMILARRGRFCAIAFSNNTGERSENIILFCILMYPPPGLIVDLSGRGEIGLMRVHIFHGNGCE